MVVAAVMIPRVWRVGIKDANILGFGFQEIPIVASHRSMFSPRSRQAGVSPQPGLKTGEHVEPPVPFDMTEEVPFGGTAGVAGSDWLGELLANGIHNIASATEHRGDQAVSLALSRIKRSRSYAVELNSLVVGEIHTPVVTGYNRFRARC